MPNAAGKTCKLSLIFEFVSCMYEQHIYITTLPIHLHYQKMKLNVFGHETIFVQDDIADITMFHHLLVAQHFKISLCALCVQLTQYTIFSETERNIVA